MQITEENRKNTNFISQRGNSKLQQSSNSSYANQAISFPQIW